MTFPRMAVVFTTVLVISGAFLVPNSEKQKENPKQPAVQEVVVEENKEPDWAKEKKEKESNWRETKISVSASAGFFIGEQHFACVQGKNNKDRGDNNICEELASIASDGGKQPVIDKLKSLGAQFDLKKVKIKTFVQFWLNLNMSLECHNNIASGQPVTVSTRAVYKGYCEDIQKAAEESGQSGVRDSIKELHTKLGYFDQGLPNGAICQAKEIGKEVQAVTNILCTFPAAN